ncbi:LysR family transcriptional regulator [Metasolibacillus sp. FSL H7-0170]|uniref:LysR family transcriptional regulator n=1 Tax=Metasolibacillus sp. FSL H7-0170 TaxID=2921431 RepID=UPI0007993007|nr:LysR family transcriptional regulator [[Bacillus] sp. KCTC 13219]
MELLQLYYFRKVAQLEHMTKAAEELHIAQPALSQMIARLESELGVQLFDRKGRKIQLNSIGKQFLQRVDAALKILEEGKREVADRAGVGRGSIYVVASQIDRLTKPMNRFLSLYPDINFRISQASMDSMLQLIDDPDVDFLFTPAKIQRIDVTAIPILSEVIYLGVPRGHRFAERDSISLKEVTEENFINYRKGHPLEQMNKILCQKAGFTPHVVCEADDAESIASLVRAGLGIAFVGSCKMDDDLVKLKITDPVCRRTYELVELKGRYRTAAAQEFCTFLIEYFSKSIEA